MAAEKGPKKKSLLVRGIATTLNSCGNAVVVSYDAGAKVVNSFLGVVKKIPGLPTKMALFTRRSGESSSRETETLYRKIKEYEGEVKAIYYEIGKASAQLDADTSEAAALRESGAVKTMLEQVKEYEIKISALKEQIIELEEKHKTEEIQKKQQDKERYRRATLMAGRARKGKESVHRNHVATDVNMSIKEALVHGTFESASDRTIFDKVATDLLDKDIEIRMLAAAELGKMGNKAAVPVLHAAIAQGDGPLVTEIINSLIALGDPKSVPIMFECSQSSHERVRVCALRGLYKLAPEDEKIRPVFHEGLGDQHPEVRKTAATMLGWLDDANAVPALVQCLTDDDARVRKAVVAALANIRDKACVSSLIRQLKDEDLEIRQRVLDAIKVISGEQVDFNVSSVGENLEAEVERLKNWWQDVRAGRETVGLTPVEETVEPVASVPDIPRTGMSGIDEAVAKAEAEMAEAERLAAEKAAAAVTVQSELEITAAQTPVVEVPAAEPVMTEIPEAALPADEQAEPIMEESDNVVAETAAVDVPAMEQTETFEATEENSDAETGEDKLTDNDNSTDNDAEEGSEESIKTKKKGRQNKNQR